MKAIVAVGISGSGKSTEFQKLEYDSFVKIERDKTRKLIMANRGKWNDYGTVNFWSIWKFSKDNEKLVTDYCQNEILQAANEGKDVVIADTNLHKGRRDELVSRLRALGYEVEIKVFPVDVSVAIKRDELRRDTVGHQVIYKQYETLCADPDYGTIKYIADVSKPPCIIVDIDGTAAHMAGKRGAFEWAKVAGDLPDPHVRFIVNALAFGPTGYKIVFLSGRDGVSYADTKLWLTNHGFHFDELFMRKAGDMRKDSIIKEELFWKHVANDYNVQFVIDDRPQCVRLWHNLGLKVFAVGNQHKEF